MARTTEAITQQEAQIWQTWAKKNNIIADDMENATLVANYFQNTWIEPITQASLDAAFEQLRPHLKFDSPARQAAVRLMQDYFDSAALAQWFDSQTLLSKEGDDGHRNFAELIKELQLQHAPATKINIDSAVMSIQHATEGGSSGKFSTRRRLPLVYAQKTERAKSHHAENDDGKNLIATSDMVRMANGDFRSKTFAEQMRDREAAEAAKNSTPKAKGPVDAWQTLCEELLRFGTHSAQQNLRDTLDRGLAQGKEYREIYGEMETLKRSYMRLLPTAKY